MFLRLVPLRTRAAAREQAERHWLDQLPEFEGHPDRPAQAARPRLESIDVLRGLVMVLMVLDHTRDFFGFSALNPRDVNDPALFITRWITHFCAPTFIFLSGVSAFLYGQRPGRTRGDVSRFLLTRGLWLIALEVTLVHLGWTFDLQFRFVTLQVIWAIGVSMILLAGLVWLPRAAIAAVGLIAIAGHNLLDPIPPEALGQLSWIWHVLHVPAVLQPTAGMHLFVLYPLIPWFAVMAMGYALGPVMLLEAGRRRRWLALAGVATTALFLALRGVNIYGDPAGWSSDGRSLLASVLSFVNTEKYPPSLLYLAMTLGPALLLMAVLDGGRRGPVGRVLLVFGRVPFLYYLAHLYVLHLLAIVVSLVMLGSADWLIGGMPLLNKPEAFGLSLPVVYGLWLGVVAVLYPLCRWFSRVKQERKDWWLSYL
jgi:uncharacterized membrane protein